jgi:hypothetical protein
MRKLRLDVVLVGALIGAGIALQGILPRYTFHNFGGDHAVRFDTWTGATCTKRILGTDEEWKERPNAGKWICSK